VIRHLLKLVWNRKRVNGLMIVEIFLSFLVVFTVVTLGVHFWSNYSRDLGFDYERVWAIEVRMDQPYSEEVGAEQVRTMVRLLREVGALDEVEIAAAASELPYDGSKWITSTELDDGRRVRTQVSRVSDGFSEVFGIRVVRGRWFSTEDDAFDREPVVISRALARDLFGDSEALGQLTDLGKGTDDNRIVGIVEDFRKSGDFSQPGNFLFERGRLDLEESRPLERLAIRVAPGVTGGFEEKLVRRLSAVAPLWSFEVEPIQTAREQYLRNNLVPLSTVGIVAGFLMLMVALGLIGVLWQNVTQRTREIGLRRATGAAQGNIHRQILTELLLITTMGLILGTITVLQVPLLHLIGNVRTAEYTSGLLASLAIVYALATACALYPSWLATRVQPAESLHYE
jgi:putative ABC transport system permease protein